MSGEPIRMRRHVDGRVALSIDGAWLTIPGEWRKDDSRCANPGWSELLVTELPEPDYAVVGTVIWDLGYGELVVNDHAELKGSLPYSVDSAEQLRSDALKMLAAADAWERRQQEASDDAR
jgi:hypothetical protein